MWRKLYSFSRSRVSYQCRRKFTVLALESSADDTCAAVVTSDRQILSNIVIKQNAEHEKYGGIHPMIAIQAHQRNMPIAVRRALDEANMRVGDIDGIAFTRGPGAGGALSVCANAAKTLASALSKPLVGVHHMQAHALTVFLTSTATSDTPDSGPPSYPFLSLLISGGHTLLLLATAPDKFEVLATTLDESIGRSFDKVSRALGLQWGRMGPGAALEQFCESSESLSPHGEPLPSAGPFSVPMPGRLAFSYSGLHSAVDRYLQQHGGALKPEQKLAVARAFQEAAVAQLEEKTALALHKCMAERKSHDQKIRHVVVSGGVASNQFLRRRLRTCLDTSFPDHHIALVFPPPSLCTDNAAMIAWASMHRFLAGNYDDYSIDHRAVWSIEELAS